MSLLDLSLFKSKTPNGAAAAQVCLALAPDPFLLLDGDKILEHSEGFAALFGLPVQSYRGALLSTLLPAPNHRRLAELLAEPQLKAWQPFSLVRGDGSTRQLEWRSLPADTVRPRVWWVVRDVTSRQRLEQALARSRDAEQAKIARDLHDGLGQKLTGLAFQLYALQSRLEREAHAEASGMQRLIKLTDEVIREVRDLAHGLAPVEISPEGLSVALHHLANTTSQLFGLECEFHTNTREDEPLPASSANPLYRIAQEAISNAHRHGHARRIVLHLREQDHLWTLTISDDGKGMATAPAGDGLGLHIMRHRAEAVGARLMVVPKGDLGGVTIRVELRQPSLRPVARKPLVAEAGESVAEPIRGRAIRVVVVDAHPVTRTGLVQLLGQDAAFNVVAECDSTQGAMEQCAILRPDLVITDILLGDGSALDYIRQMRKVFPALRIVVLSLYPPERYDKPAREAGADLYLGKQLAPRILIDSLRTLVLQAD